MNTSAFVGLQPSGTTVEPTTEDNCDKCAKLDDVFPCADCYISGYRDFSGDSR